MFEGLLEQIIRGMFRIAYRLQILFVADQLALVYRQQDQRVFVFHQRNTQKNC